MKKTKKFIVFVFWILVWQALYMAIGKDIIFASPVDTLKVLINLITTAEFYKIIGLSFIRTAAGFFAGALTGIFLGSISVFNNTVKSFINPFIDIVRAAPVASFIILALIWIKTGFIPVFISFLTVVPIVWSSILTGAESVDIKLLEMAQVFEYPFTVKLKKIYVPAVKPYLKAAAVTGAGFAFKSGIAAEIIASPVFSIGRKLQESRIYFETAELFAWTAVVIILSMIFEKLLVKVVGR